MLLTRNATPIKGASRCTKVNVAGSYQVVGLSGVRQRNVCSVAAGGPPTSNLHEDLAQKDISTAFSKRQLLQASLSLSLALATPQTAQAEGNQVYFDVNLEGRPLGRIVVELFEDVKVGAARFRDLAIGKEGVHYQLSRFDGIFPTYLRCNGVKSLSYSATAESPIAGGDSTEVLEQELASQNRQHSEPGIVSLIVKESEERPVKERLVAKQGKLVTQAEQLGEAPNATGFTILRAADESLNRTNLIVGRVVSGTDVIDTIAAQPFAKPRDSLYDGPFFNAAKAIGDKRATTAEKGFNRPLKRIIVANSGVV